MLKKEIVISNQNYEERRGETVAHDAVDMQHKIVIRMLKNGLSLDMIMKCTGLSKAEIEKIKNRN